MELKLSYYHIKLTLLAFASVLAINATLFAQINVQSTDTLVNKVKSNANNATQKVDKTLTKDNLLLATDSNIVNNGKDTLISVNDSLIIDSNVVINVLDTSSFPIAESTDVENEIVYNAADSIVYDLENETIFLYGKANFKYDDIDLSAGQITFKYANKVIIAEAKKDSLNNLTELPLLKEGEEEYVGNKMVYNVESKRGKITKLSTKYDEEGYIQGKEVLKNEHNELLAKDAFYTTCSHDEPHFKISVDKVKIIPKKAIVSGPANLQIADVPTPLILPFAFFPINEKRNAGLVAPKIGKAPGTDDLYAQSQLYIPVNDFLDLSFPFALYTNGRFNVGAKSRYKVKYRYSGDFGLDWNRTVGGDKITADFTKNDVYSIVWNHRQDGKARPNSSFSSNVNIKSSDFYSTLNEVNNIATTLSNTFGSSISYSYNFPRLPLSFTSSLRHSQNVNTKAFDVTFPSVNLTMQRQYPFVRKNGVGSKKWYEKIGVGYTMKAENRLETFDSLLLKRETYSNPDNFRNGVSHNIPIQFNGIKFLKHLTFSPSFSYTERWIFNSTDFNSTQNINPEDGNYTTIDTITNTGFNRVWDYTTSASVNTRLYGFINLKKGKIKAIRHVANPSLSFSYNPDWQDEKYGYFGRYNEYQEDTVVVETYNRFPKAIYGVPSSGLSKSINFSVSNQIDMKVRKKEDSIWVDKKVDLLRSLSTGISYNFAADSFNLSDINISANTMFLNKLNVQFGATFDPYYFDAFSDREINKLHFLETNKIARFKRFNLTTSANFSAKDFNKEQNKDKFDKYDEDEVYEMNTYPERFYDFDNPWNFGFRYTFNVTRDFDRDYFGGDTVKISANTLNFDFDLNLSPKWKVGANSGYDFASKEMSTTNLNFVRDLHCWQMVLNWVPFGDFKSYNFTINVKSAILQDLKLTRRRSWQDN